MKKLLKFLMLLVYVFVASNLKLDAANGEERFKQDLRDDCAICYRSFYNKDGDKNLIDAEGQVIPVNPEEQLVSEGDSARLVPFEGLEIITLPCGHMFHNTDDCFKGHLTSRRTNANICPICRAQHEIQIPQLQQLTVAQPQREDIQNSIIIPRGTNLIECQILTQEGFIEVKNYLQEHPEVVKLKLELTDNTRQIPEEFFVNLSHLRELELSNNQLPELPASIGQLTNLEELSLYRNRLISLPPEIGLLGELEKLDLSNNRLTSLPRSIGSLINLEYLDLQCNHIIPWPTELINQLERQNLDDIFGEITQTPAPQSTQPVSFFKRIGRKIKFAFGKLFKRKA